MRTFACACIVLVAGSAFSQVELVDPDAPGLRPRQKPAIDEVDPAAATEDADDDAPQVRPGPLSRKPADAGVKDRKEKLKDLKPLDPRPPLERPPPPPIESRVITDADLAMAWEVWRAANEKASSDIKGEQVARQRLLELKEVIGASNLETWAVALLRAAEAHEARGDSGGAVEIALTATQLAPDLPATWVGLARVYFLGDPSAFGRTFGALQNAVVTQVKDPRFARTALADVLTTLLLALLITAVVVVAVLAVRRGAYALYDFHFLFPRVASRWQTGALALVLLSLPIVFRMGLVPVLLAFFFALALYLTFAERVVVAVLIALLGAVPPVAGLLVERLAFAGTRAEPLMALERGGPGNEAFAAELARLAAEDKASYVELMALGRFDLRRGRVAQAARSFRKALTIRPNDPAARVNLGMALVLDGDLENPRALFEEAGKAAPQLPQAPYNLARLTQRRIAVMGDKVAGEADVVARALSAARAADPSFRALSTDDEGTPRSMLANVYLQSVPLPQEEYLEEARAVDAGRRVKSQVLQLLVGEVNETLALFYPGLLALLVVLFGSLAPTLQAARPCTKCGRPVSKRSDPDVSVGSLMCTGCVNVFARKNVAAPSLKVRKQLEVARYQSRIERTGSILGFLCSGMGHVFAGFPARGALYGFFFVALLTGVVLRNGVVRAPFEPLPLVVRLAPLGLLLVLVYVLTLRGLRKKQGAG